MTSPALKSRKLVVRVRPVGVSPRPAMKAGSTRVAMDRMRLGALGLVEDWPGWAPGPAHPLAAIAMRNPQATSFCQTFMQVPPLFPPLRDALAPGADCRVA